MNGDEMVKMVGVTKKFGPITALNQVDFSVFPQEIVALVGDNGAGKSTLIRIICGIWAPTSGQVFFEGKRLTRFSPDVAGELGIHAVHQGFGLVDTMSIARNVLLGEEPYKGGFLRILDLEKMWRASVDVLNIIGTRSQISPSAEVATLSGGEKQAIKIGRSVYHKAKLIIMDEPTMALSVRERHRVLELAKETRDKGISVIFISHNIHMVYDICDRVVVMERGEKIGDYRKEDVDVEDIVDLIREGKEASTFKGNG